MWMVELVRDGHSIRHYFGGNYFPRKFFRRHDAETLADRIRHMGGQADVARFKK